MALNANLKLSSSPVQESWGGMVNNPAGDTSVSDPGAAMSPKGQATSFWARLAQVGAAKIQRLDLMKDISQAPGAVGRFVAGGVAKGVNTAVEGARQIGYTAEMGLANKTHNPIAFRNANMASQANYRQANKSNAGLLNAGTFFKNGQEAQSGSLSTVSKRVGAGMLQVAGDVLPMAEISKVGKVYKLGQGIVDAAKIAEKGGTAVLKKTAEQAALGGAASGLSSVGSQSLNGKVSVEQTVRDIASGIVLGGGMYLAGVGVGKIFKDGSDVALHNVKTAAQHDIMSSQTADKAANAVRQDIPVKDTSTGTSKVGVTKIGETTPVKPGIKQISETNKITVRTPQRMTDSQFHTEFNKLSDSYNKESKKLEASSKILPTAQLKANADKIEAKYQAKLNDLQDRYNNPKLSDAKAPKQIASKTLPAEKTTGGKAPDKVLTKGDTRPSAAIQTAIEKAHNSGDTAKTESLIKQLPDASTRDAMRSSVGLPTKETKIVVNPLTKKTERIPLPIEERPKESVSAISGSALKSEQRAVKANLVKSFEDKATYDSGSYKTEAEKAVKLANENPQKAMDIAMGKKPGDNVMHEVAVRHAVEQKAIQEGDTATVQRLASSKQHTATSEAAQRLGSEGHNTMNNPVEHIRDVQATRAAAYEKQSKVPLTKALTSTAKEIDSHIVKPTKETWTSFIESIKC